ncbi:MAG: hypothetical protein JNM88_15735 [Chitinophagaceae bacterium]|nr:hypothetical protein [Chitinophagaceae bacterium]
MRFLVILTGIAIMTASLVSCKSSGDAPKSFCDTACLKDTLKFTGDHALKPYVYITAKNCLPDSIIWSFKGIGIRKTGFTYLLGTTVNINPDVIRYFFRDTAVAYVIFNDCSTGRGFQITLPYNKSKNFSLKSSGINSFDPKFSIEKNLLVSTDRGNIFVEDMSTGKTAEMTFGEKIEIDYDAIHDHIDSVNVTSDRIWAKVLIGKEWVVKEKKISLQ